MTLRLYNSLGRKLQTFAPLEGKNVRFYSCGPTVWDYAHVGNFRTFVFNDVLRRYLEYSGYRPVQVMNITDVEDKIIKGMKRTGLSLKALTSRYEAAFMEDLSSLNVERAERYPRATEHISDMVALIRTLLDKGYAYRGEDGSTYFAVSKFKRYGRLSGVKPEELRAGARVAQDHYEKEDARDFALWKAWDPEDGEVFWETELGKGRPGWSIECSAMSMKYLGESFDIHTGGKDLRFPHHENEIAQSEAATGRPFVKYWLHTEFLSVSGEEMHKSSGNIITLRELLSRGWDPLSIRFFLVSAHYREPVDLNDAALQQADAARRRLQDLWSRAASLRGKDSETRVGSAAAALTRDFRKAMDDDLNTPKALAAVFSFVKEANSVIDAGGLGATSGRVLAEALESVDSVLGVLRREEEALSQELASLVREREEARRRRDFATADRIRKELLAKGLVVEDTPRGTVWRRTASDR